MSAAVLTAWLHYLGIMALAASLLGEHVVLKADLSLAQARTIQRLDMIFGVSAGVVLVTGIARMFLEKGAMFYMAQLSFHVLVGLFIIIGLLSIYPTVAFIRWRPWTRTGAAPVFAAGQFKRLKMVIRLELALLVVAPLFATVMAHGHL